MCAKQHFVYKISNTNFRVMQNNLSVKQELTYQNVANGTTNSLAYDHSNSTLFFIKSDLKLYYIQSGDTVATEVSGFTSPTYQPANAAYYNGAIWYFEFNSNVLVKLTLSYSLGVPSVASKTTYSVGSMSLPTTGTVGANTNTFGDITIDSNTGTLYAYTSRGRFYSVDLSNPTAGFTEIVSSPGNDRTVGLQLVYNDSTNTLYGHNHKTGNWYTINTSTGAKTDLSLNTGLFRDLAGNSSSAMYGNDVDGNIFTVNITQSNPTTLDQFFLPSGTLTLGANNFTIGVQSINPDQRYRIGILNTTSTPYVKINWGDKTLSSFETEGYYEHVYEDLIAADVQIQGDLGGGELVIGGKPIPVYTTAWGSDYQTSEMTRTADNISGLTNVSSVKFTNNVNLTTVPSGLFNNVVSTITNLDNAFENTGLTVIPSGLLTSMTGVTSYVATFRDCDDITAVPIPLLNVHTGITTMANFLDYTEITNYDAFLDWLYTQANSINLQNITLGACGNTTSNSTGATARSNLINNLGWTINDGSCGGVPPTATPAVTPTATPAATPTATPTGSGPTPTATGGSTPTPS